MSEGFGRLTPALQYHIVNTLGFSALTPVQERAIGPVTEGKNCVILAPTAGGKTEAALFPLLALMDREDWQPVSVIYIAPIRALLNNQIERLSRYASMIGRRAFLWHGDVSTGDKRRFCRDPSDLLLTTPESLEVMLMSERVPAQRLFTGLRAAVVDEVHAFVGDDRGGHLSAVLERLSRYAGRDVQRIGLSATVGNPEDILRWAAGSSRRAGVVVAAGPGRAGSQRQRPALMLDWVGSEANAATVIAQLHPGKKRLVFVDSRRGVEALGRHLSGLGVDVHVIHSSLALAERQAAELAFRNRQDCVIVATSALELGIDIGDLDHVIQINAPGTVAALMQRMGRTGRRPGTVANCTLLATKEDALVQAAALLRLYDQGFVEPLPLRRRAAHLLAHQILALCIQERGVAAADWWAWIAQATPFQGLTARDRDELLAFMQAQDIVVDIGGRLVLGDRGERLYGWRNFAELYAVFQTPQTLTVLWGGQEIGAIDALFAAEQELPRLSFVLAARPWQAVDINWNEGVVRVVPIADSAVPRWQGRAALLHRPLCQTMRSLLIADARPSAGSATADDPWWSRRAQKKLHELRAGYAFLSGAEGSDLVPDPSGYRLWTFAGGRTNHLLARVLEAELGERVTVDNCYIGFREQAGKSEAAIGQVLARLGSQGRPSHDDALHLAARCARTRLSKFQPCLPPRLEAEYFAELLTDPEGAAAVARAPVRYSAGSSLPGGKANPRT